MRTAAFFDIDHTLIAADSGLLFVQYLVRRGLMRRRSYFYSDSITDLPVLSRVGHPRPVNPDRLLRRHAQRQGWPVIDATNSAPVAGLAP